jgi:hypothetical protein
MHVNESTRSTSSARNLLLALGVLSASACSAHGSIPDITVTESDLQFQGVPAEISALDESPTLTTRFEHPGDLDLPDFLNPELHVVRASMRAEDGVSDLSFVRTLKLVLGSDAPNAPAPVTMADYERRPGQQVGDVLHIDADRDVDVMQHWETGEAYYELTLSGDGMPSRDWSVQVTVQFSGTIDVSP